MAWDAGGAGGAEPAHFNSRLGGGPGRPLGTSGRSRPVVGRDSGAACTGSSTDARQPFGPRPPGTPSPQATRPHRPRRHLPPRLSSRAEAHGRLLVGGRGSRGGRAAARDFGRAAWLPPWTCPRGKGVPGGARARPGPRRLLLEPELGDGTCGPPSAPTTHGSLPVLVHQARPHLRFWNSLPTAPSRTSSRAAPPERLPHVPCRYPHSRHCRTPHQAPSADHAAHGVHHALPLPTQDQNGARPRSRRRQDPSRRPPRMLRGSFPTDQGSSQQGSSPGWAWGYTDPVCSQIGVGALSVRLPRRAWLKCLSLRAGHTSP